MTPGAQQICDLVKGGVGSSTPKDVVQRFFDLCVGVGGGLGVTWYIDPGTSVVESALIIRAAVMGRLDRAGELSVLAASRGYLLPPDPRQRIASLNSRRQLFSPIDLPSQDSVALAKSILDLCVISAQYDSGFITFERPRPSAQIASFEVSLDGIASQTGDALADILGYQPDADFVKRKRALDSLARLDFSKRRPYPLFTADVITDGRRRDGTIICWTKMHDASGYRIGRRDVFAEIDLPSVTLDAGSLEMTTRDLLDDNEFIQCLSFYDWVSRDDVVAFVDDSTRPDTLYAFTITGLQNKMPATTSPFDVQASALYLSPAQVQLVNDAVKAEATSFGVSMDSISPYPALASVVYGDPGYGWILAGVNVISAIRRGDDADRIRRLSYLGARLDDILSEAQTGRLSTPGNAVDVHENVDAAVASFGISQTILSVLDGTGVTEFVSGKDDPLGFKPTQASLETSTGALARILAAIDPVTAVLDPSVLVSSLTSRSIFDHGPRLAPSQLPATLSIAGSEQPQSDSRTLSATLGDELLDLTTYEGIAGLMRIIRVTYDFFPGAMT